MADRPTEPPVEELWLTTADGNRLEAELAVPDEPWAAALLCHPHPQQGGSMRSMVTSHLFSTLPALGLVSLRFNFRGVGRSEGTHDRGVGERHDVVAGLDALHPIVEGLPLMLVGWSFGADTSLTIDDDRHDGWCAIAPPLRIHDPDKMVAATDPRPKVLVIGENDQFRTPGQAEPVVASWPHCRVVAVGGADHFFGGRLADTAAAVIGLGRHLSPQD